MSTDTTRPKPPTVYLSTSNPNDALITIRYLTDQVRELKAEVKRLRSRLRSPVLHREPTPIHSWNRIITICAEEWSVSTESMMSSDRTESVALARFAAMRLLRQQGMTLERIGRIFRRNHCTVMYGLRSLDDKIATSRLVADRIRRLDERSEVDCG